MANYFNTIWEFWKPYLVSGDVFAYFFFVLFGFAIGLFIYQIIRWIFYKEKPYWLGDNNEKEKRN